ncbi:hypothetical protein FNF29_03894 [Cafeteria roenbergensis]|uniref:Uncharacterized protein n=1 Tax=Cafeteria roenbergensis TaxID=33653 RepID=A0A5A8CHL5_CAFRO|nr:hypothetical protein FNF29_03894 [Cafeteria roenbergensis]|eukprot:KAA0152328.1 hypothetical protein FNF29_03894 [Cafeteria roenbergensis]
MASADDILREAGIVPDELGADQSDDDLDLEALMGGDEGAGGPGEGGDADEEAIYAELGLGPGSGGAQSAASDKADQQKQMQELLAAAAGRGLDLDLLESAREEAQAAFAGQTHAQPAPGAPDQARSPPARQTAGAPSPAQGQTMPAHSASSTPGPSLHRQLSETLAELQAAAKAGDFDKVSRLSGIARTLKHSIDSSAAADAPGSADAAAVAKELRENVSRIRAAESAMGSRIAAAQTADDRAMAQLGQQWLRREAAQCEREAASIEAGLLAPGDALAVAAERSARSDSDLAGFKRAVSAFMQFARLAVEQSHKGKSAGAAGEKIAAWWRQQVPIASQSAKNVLAAAAVPYQPPPVVAFDSAEVPEVLTRHSFPDLAASALQVQVLRFHPGPVAPPPSQVRVAVAPLSLVTDTDDRELLAMDWHQHDTPANPISVGKAATLQALPTRPVKAGSAADRLIRKAAKALVQLEVQSLVKGWIRSSTHTVGKAWAPVAGIIEDGQWEGRLPIEPADAKPPRPSAIDSLVTRLAARYAAAHDPAGAPAASGSSSSSSSSSAAAAAAASAAASGDDHGATGWIDVRLCVNRALKPGPAIQKVSRTIPKLVSFPTAAVPTALATAEARGESEASPVSSVPAASPAGSGEAPSGPSAPAPAPAQAARPASQPAAAAPPPQAAPAAAAAAAPAPVASRYTVPPAELRHPLHGTLLVSFGHLTERFDELNKRLATATMQERVGLEGERIKVGQALDTLEELQSKGQMKPAGYALALEQRRLRDVELAHALMRAKRADEARAVAGRTRSLKSDCEGMVEGGILSAEDWANVQEAARRAVYGAPAAPQPAAGKLASTTSPARAPAPAPAPAPAAAARRAAAPPPQAAPAAAAAAAPAPAASRYTVPPAELRHPLHGTLLVSFGHLTERFDELNKRLATATMQERVGLEGERIKVGQALDTLEELQSKGQMKPAGYALALEQRRLRDVELAHALMRAKRADEARAVAGRTRSLKSDCEGMVEGGILSAEDWANVQEAARREVYGGGSA